MNYIKKYNQSLNSINRKVRKNLFDHKDKIYHLDFNESIILWVDKYNANSLLKQYTYLYNLQWNIIFLKDHYSIENNFPHTHNKYIFLPQMYFTYSKEKRIRILIHEKIHVFQRFYPILYNKLLLEYFNLDVLSLLSSHPLYKHVRRNPDVNDIIYGNIGEYNLPIFNHNPVSLLDFNMKTYNAHGKNTIYSNILQHEHPNETIAYYMEDMIYNQRNNPNIVNYFV